MNFVFFKSLMPLYFFAAILFALAACNPKIDSAVEPTGNINPTNEVTSVESTEVVEQTLTPVVTLTPKPTLSLEFQTTTPPPISAPILQDYFGKLLVYDSFGIRQVNLSDNTQEYILTKQNDWIDWGANFAKNQDQLAYWVKNENKTELWFTSITHWQPKLVMSLDNVEYDFATLLWGVNDRYLLLNLSILDDSSLLEDIKTIRTYIIDTNTMEFVNSSYWSGDCSILARSPQTNQLALWCDSEDTDHQEYLVLEPDEAPWLTLEAPTTLIDNCLIMATCDWSKDGEFVAYIDQNQYPESLYYTLVNIIEPIRLDDGQTKAPAFLSWSPNSQYLYYSGACKDGTSQCPNTISIANQEVIWRARDNYNKGEFGNIAVDHVAWSPDSLFLAMPVLDENNTGEQILIFNLLAQEEMTRVSNMDAKIFDLIWLDD